MKRFFALFALLAMATTVLLAADPWKAKKYTEWTEKEVDKVLRDSPWARAVTVSPPDQGAGGARSGGRGGRGGRGGGGGGGGMSASEGISAGGSSRGIDENPVSTPSSMEGMSGSSSSRSLLVLLRWQSALPVRQALLRRQIQLEKLTPEKAEEALKLPVDVYVLVLSQLPMAMMQGTSPEKVKSSTFLKRGAGEPIALQELKMAKGERPELYFFFPRTGKPLSLEDKTVEFVTKLGRLEVKKKFALKDLVFDGKPEL